MLSDTDWKNFGQLSNIFRGVLQTDFYVNTGIFWEEILLEKIISFHHFWILGENVSTFRREDFGCDQQNWILFNHSNNCNKFVFFVIFEQWLNSTCPQEHFEEKKSFSRKNFNFILSFSDNERTLLALWQTFWTWLSELLSTCPWEHFEEIYFIEQEIVVHLSFLDTRRKFIILLAKNFRLSVKLFSKELYDFHSACPETHLGEIFFLEVFFRTLRTFFEHHCQNCFWRVHNNTLRKTTLLNKKFSCFYNSWTLSENLSTVWGNFSAFC